MNLTPYLLLSSERVNAETGHRCRRASSRPTKPPLNGYCGYAADKILIPTYYVGGIMGRQHTTWISDETWDKLQNIEGKSVSNKIAIAIKQADPDQQMIINARMRQLAAAKSYLREISKVFDGEDRNLFRQKEEVDKILDRCAFLIWEADMDVKQ